MIDQTLILHSLPPSSSVKWLPNARQQFDRFSAANHACFSLETRQKATFQSWQKGQSISPEPPSFDAGWPSVWPDPSEALDKRILAHPQAIYQYHPPATWLTYIEPQDSRKSLSDKWPPKPEECAIRPNQEVRTGHRESATSWSYRPRS